MVKPSLPPAARHGNGSERAPSAALWVAVYLPQLALQAFAETVPPESRGLPLALLDGARIAAVDAVAARLGLAPGMRRATGLALAPHTVFGHADAVREARMLQAVVHAALAFTPSVTQQGAQLVLLEVSTTQRAFGGLPRLLERLRDSLSPLGLGVRLATAPTAAAAGILARWEGRDLPVLGAHTRRLDVLCGLLDEAPLALLHSLQGHHEALLSMGLHTLGQLRALPRDGLARRFGPALLDEIDGARGQAAQAHRWCTLPERFESRLELFARADTTEQVLHGAGMLLTRLVTWAQARRGRIRRLQLQMLHEPRHREDDRTPDRSTLDIALAEPGNDTAHLGTLLREHLARLPLPAPTLELRICCDELDLGEPSSGELFPTRASEREGLLRLVERLQARLGREHVRRVQPVADHRPERATRLLPLESLPAAGSAPVRAAAVPDVAAAPLTRPVWLLPQPQALADRQSAPWLDGHPLLMLAGPERIEAGWWDGEPVVRDYFVAQAHDGSVVWIYRSRLPPDEAAAAADPPGGGWFLHGRFA